MVIPASHGHEGDRGVLLAGFFHDWLYLTVAFVGFSSAPMDLLMEDANFFT